MAELVNLLKFIELSVDEFKDISAASITQEQVHTACTD